MGIYFLAAIYLWLLCGYLYVILFLFRNPRFWEIAIRVKHPFLYFLVNMAKGPIFFVRSIRIIRKRKRELQQQKENPEES